MKNKLIRISLLLLALLMVFCLFACGGEEEATVEKVTVTFDLGRGEFADEDFGGSMEIEKNTTIKKFPEANRKGYILEGWYLDEDCEEACDSSYKFSANTTLYANWEKAPTYKVTFNTSRAGDGKTVPAQDVMHGGKVTDPGYTPTKKGLVFYGWCVDADKNRVWDFDKDVVTSDLVIWAVFVSEGSGDTGDTTECEHDFVTTEYEAPTCESNGKLVQRCSKCRVTQRFNHNNNDELKKLPHLELEERVEPTCAVDGYSTIYCPNGCGLSKTSTLRATGNHEYDRLNWTTVIKPTKYVNGKLQNLCVVCGGAPQERTSPYNALEEELAIPDISFIYTGGAYVNEKFVNVASLGKVLASSYFNGTGGYMANDGNINTFWNADTYADGVSYTSDWVILELARAYDVGAISFTLPNYTQWELGEDCYVSYDIEYWDEATQSWIFVAEVSDKNAVSMGLKCQFMLELDEPINTDKIRARVTHATRYAPAVIYEVEAYAKTEDTERLPQSIAAQANVTISGKYNDWVSGSAALTDETSLTYWTTDARYNPNPWVTYEFPSETYIACIQFSTSLNQGRKFKLEICKNGEWSTVGSYVVPKEGGTGEGVVSAENGICLFNVDLEDTISQFKLTITNEPQYWTSYVHDVTPYTVVEQAKGEPIAAGCGHQNPQKGPVIAPTCDTAGYTQMNCVCGAIVRTNATDMLGHDFGKYTIQTPATATTLGVKAATCRNEGCGAVSKMNYEENYDAPVITPYLHGAPAAWAQTFDDGNYLETYVWANEYYVKYGARATIMQSITYSDSLVSIWQEHFKVGVFDLGSHSYNHTTDYAGDLSATTFVHEVIDAQNWFRGNHRGQKVLVFAAPLGATSTGVADYLAGVLAANRNGGDTGIFYNTLDELTNRLVWGDMNSYISKADQTEGDYVFVSKDGKTIYVKNEEGVYAPVESYKHKGVNYIFDENAMTFVDKGYSYEGTYYFSEADYRYDYLSTGSYNLNGSTFTFVNDNSGNFKLVKATIGSYEKGVEKLVSVGGITVECLHSLGFGSIYSSYESTISKLEHIARFGVWAPSYNDLVMYIKESQNATVEIVDRTEDSITVSVTDNLDNYMFNFPVTVKLDIPDTWTTVTATQNGKEIPLVAYDFYKQTKNMNTVSCAIDEGYLYIDIIPDAGDVVVTVGEKGQGADYADRVTVTFEPGEGILESSEYEMKVLVGQLASETVMPTPVREGYKFLGWDYLEGHAFTEDITLNAIWEEIPKCTDGTYTHEWGSWLPTANGEEHTCKNCGLVESREVEKAE